MGGFKHSAFQLVPVPAQASGNYLNDGVGYLIEVFPEVVAPRGVVSDEPIGPSDIQLGEPTPTWVTQLRSCRAGAPLVRHGANLGYEQTEPLLEDAKHLVI